MELFKDRADAGRKLADMLTQYAGEDAVVLAVPRGGVVIAEQIADRLGAELDIVVSRKIGAPMNPELAIGAVGPDRRAQIDEKAVKELHVAKGYIERQARIECIEIDRRNLRYREGRKPVGLKGRTVILVDDGIATGMTLLSALKSLRKSKPKKIVVAVPVASPRALKPIEKEADEVVCLELPKEFIAIGEFYRRFEQVADEEVIDILRRASKRGV